jgi:hypothetical protein
MVVGTRSTVDGVRTIRRLGSAVIIGFGMIFASRRSDQHWTERPVAADVEPGTPSPGDPPAPGDVGTSGDG